MSEYYYSMVMDTSKRPLVLCDSRIYDLKLAPLNPYIDLSTVLDPANPIIFLETAETKFDSEYTDYMDKDPTLQTLRREFHTIHHC
ncbi:hypothetical protein EC988_003700 [Linderina pennispora]|nr:hypothetical protein EC988_003700 [Linderina pennispora]